MDRRAVWIAFLSSLHAKESIAALNHITKSRGLLGSTAFMMPIASKLKLVVITQVAKSYLGIDKGLVLLVFENYSTQLIWRLLHQNAFINRVSKYFNSSKRFQLDLLKKFKVNIHKVILSIRDSSN